jgi:uncharacterized protein YydD (DUF2326 family)
MRLSKLYSNKPGVFAPIGFHDGLNVVVGEIHHPKDRKRDTHGLGKSLLAEVIDFCLLRQRDNEFFLFKHHERFKDFVFFLEIATHGGDFVTVRRAVEPGSKASLVCHRQPHRDFCDVAEIAWDHWNVAFDRAKTLLDGILGLTAVSPWAFRRAVPYSLRGW